MKFSDELLMAYADGELDARTRAEIEEAMTQDPQIAQRVASHTALRDSVRSSFDPVLKERIPDRLIAATRALSSAMPDQRVVPLRRRRAPGRSWAAWSALAASVVVAALVLQFGTRRNTAGPVSSRDGQLLASGALEHALSNQLVADQSARDPVRIGVSFRSRRGSLCRTFQLRAASALAGLACREDNRWKLEVLAQEEPSHDEHAAYRPAASALPPAVIQAVNDHMVGDPLDSRAEAAARASQWRSTR